MEQDEFMKDLGGEGSDIFAEEPAEQATPEVEIEEDRSNRRTRRLEKQLQDEREAGIAMAARLQALSEVQQFRNDSEPTEYEKKIERIYGNQTPEAIEATNLLRDAFKGVHKQAKDDAIAAFREEQREQSEAEGNEDKTLDAMVEEIEDEYGVTIDAATSKMFFSRLERLSPKDKDGNVTSYADHHAMWEDMQTKTPPHNRAKDLASRSVARTGGASQQDLSVDANEKWLRANGII